MLDAFRLFQDKILILNKFLTELATSEEEITYTLHGLKRVLEWKSFKNAYPIIEEFEGELLEIEDLAKFIDKDIHKQIKMIKEESKLIDQLSTISIQLNLVKNKTQKCKTRLSASSEIINTILFRVPIMSTLFKDRMLFSKEKISIQKTLVSLSRLNSLTKRLEKLYLRAHGLDNEIFSPSKINSNLLIDYLNSAIEELEIDNSIATEDKKRLIEYIISAKIEISGNKPNWNKAIGALVIVATLLGGIGVAPQAYDNVTKAIQHVLGVSIEKHVPNMLPAPIIKKEKNTKDKTNSETIIT